MFGEKFIILFAFTLFLTVVFVLAGAKILALIDAHSSDIAKDILGAKSAKEEAEKLLKEAKQSKKDAEIYAESLIKSAEKESLTIVSNAQNKVKQDIANKKEIALQRITQMENKATDELKKEITEIIMGEVHQSINENQEEVAKTTLDSAIKKIHSL